MLVMAPYVVYPAEAGGQRLSYDGFYPVGVLGQGHFLPPWMAVWPSDRPGITLGLFYLFFATAGVPPFCFVFWDLVLWLCASSYAEAGWSLMRLYQLDISIQRKALYPKKIPLLGYSRSVVIYFIFGLSLFIWHRGHQITVILWSDAALNFWGRWDSGA